MKRYVLFGAGAIGKQAMKILGRENIAFFIDNSQLKNEKQWCGLDVYFWDQAKDKLNEKLIVITVTEKHEDKIIEQLRNNGIKKFVTFRRMQEQVIKPRKEMQQLEYSKVYALAKKWIYNHTINGEAIINNTDMKKGYPEVTGYYIPTLLNWGNRDLAIAYAKWLCSIQKADGSFYDTEDVSPYVFDTAQILKGLLAIRKVYPDVDNAIRRGCDWVLSNMKEDGRLVTPNQEEWGEDGVCSELIHIYCLSPLVEASYVFDIPEYREKAYKILDYYKKNYYQDIVNFRILSHFYAYIMEGLLDLGEIGIVREAMEKVSKLQKESGAVPAYSNVDWICSTGLFQFALVWFRLGEIEKGNKAFEYACTLQNESGGWFGSYLAEENMNELRTYFPTSEISWVVKYFLDALKYKYSTQLGTYTELFMGNETKDDEKYIEILKKLD